MRYREPQYRSIEDFRVRETPSFDSLSDAIDGLMDALFLDEVHRYAQRDEDDLFDKFDGEVEWAT